MPNIAIHAEKISKQYRIGEKQERYKTFRDSLSNSIKAIFSHSRANHSNENRIWALKDVSFEVQPGEVLGIIGRNGAGKSTLLKILPRITKPTSGSARVYGRVGSLLEVGTGFHPELTGRENIYLNGAIIGMRRSEIERKFDEMVAFAEIDRFLDTPVKRYSSGMYVRLAFSVAAHLEPEILLVDEVLAVGDAAFQKKCLGKMSEVAGGGRTVLFVSHNMAAVRRLCTRVIYLRDGQIEFNGDTLAAIDMYLGAYARQLKAVFSPKPDSPIRIHQIEIRNGNGQPADGDIETSEGFRIRVTYDINYPIRGVHAFLRIHLPDGETLLSTGDADTAPVRLGERSPGRFVADIAFPPRLLGEGNYSVTWSAGVPFQSNYDVEFHAVSFHITDYQNSRGEFIHNRRPGFLALDLNWTYYKPDADL